MITNLIQFHTDVFFLLHNLTHISPGINKIIYFIAQELDWYMIFFAAVFMILHVHQHNENKPHIISRHSLTEGIYVFFGVMSAWAISYIMKISFAIPRPFLQFPEIAPLFLHGGFNSFPSGHATFFAALAMAIFLHHKKVGLLFVFAAFLIGLTRVISGVHFPVDILFGWLLGSVVSYVVYYYLIQKK